MQAGEIENESSRHENDDDDTESIWHAHFASVSEKQLPAKCKPDTLTYCPTMDLVALATEDEQVHVFRLNGQKVFGGFARGGGAAADGLKVKSLKWKGNGHLLAVATSDNNVRILSAYSGKTVHVLPCNASLEYGVGVRPREPVPNVAPSICCLGWGVNLTDGKSVAKAAQETQGRLAVEDILTPETPLSKLAYIKADLPRELALLDIDRSLPKLSTLPSTARRLSRLDTDSDSVDVLLAGFDDGAVHIRIFDSFEIGSIHVQQPLDSCEGSRALVHASHPMSSTHAFLFRGMSGDTERLWIFSLDLLFITKSGRYLSVLASKVTQLQNLLRYIKQVQTQIHLEWKNSQDLPGRYLRNINEDLQDRLNCDFVTAAYHLVVTGDCFEPLKEFLVDQVGERVLINSGRELVQFDAFSRWLRYEIDLQSTDPLSATAEELMEKADTINHGHTLNYLQGGLIRSGLLDFIQPTMQEPSNGRWSTTDADGLFYENYKKTLQKLAKRKQGETVAAPMLSDLTARLSVQLQGVFKRIAETQRRSILERHIQDLGIDMDPNAVDLTMSYENYEGVPKVSIFLAARAKMSTHTFYLERVVLTTVNGVSSTEVVLTAKISFQKGSIMDIKFVEDGTIMLLWSDGNTPALNHLIQIPYKPDVDPSFSLNYVKRDHSDHLALEEQIIYLDLLTPSSHHASFVRHTFPQRENMEPLHIEVNGRRGRRVVCVLYSDRQWYSVFDIDSVDDRDDEDEEDIDEDAGSRQGDHGDVRERQAMS
ncbi:conserved hypothetical protein [Uncinocarpus reesii 1704]|uniref:Anaphase-promoting complex subunit 4 n=1 Tax=Uncinocarpus reesii (strain UAMH 1704) TaxID=336963 RepID=C4JI97_UNCRE|nr:uncharacterized protein UREG_02843 [Uncinocarpus reesii 1704]EEP77994.1 conserved hypothetical protein [Uncinocarpus reesii 1704]